MRKKTVDATYMDVTGTLDASAGLPGFCQSVDLIPLNDLSPKVQEPRSEYVVIGAGKTGIDAVLFLIAIAGSRRRAGSHLDHAQ